MNLEGDEFSPVIVVFVPNVFGTAFTELLLVQSLCSECFWNSFYTVTQQHNIHCWSTLITPFEVVQAGVTLNLIYLLNLPFTLVALHRGIQLL